MKKPEKTIKKLSEGSAASIAAIGDSLTYGWMVNKGYIDYLEEMIRKKYPDCTLAILNRGVPGDTAHGGLYRVQNDIIQYEPDTVIVQFGLNDIFTGCPAEQFKHNLEGIVEKISDQTDAEIILITSVYLMDPRMDHLATEFYEIIYELSSDRGLSFVKVHEYWKKKINGEYNHRDLIQYDGVHPNDQGHKLMAEAVMEVF